MSHDTFDCLFLLASIELEVGALQPEVLHLMSREVAIEPSEACSPVVSMSLVNLSQKVFLDLRQPVDDLDIRIIETPADIACVLSSRHLCHTA